MGPINLSQKFVLFGFAIPMAIFIWAFILLKIADFAEEGWRNNNRKKKWIVCLFLGAIVVLRNVDYLFLRS